MSASKQDFILVANDNRKDWHNPKLSSLQTAQILNTNQTCIKHDLSLVTIALLKKKPENKHIVDHFIKRFIEYREYSTMSPTDYDARPLLGNIVAHLCDIDSTDTIDECFGKLQTKADNLCVQSPHALPAFETRIVCAKNTSNRIRHFIQHHDALLSQKQFEDTLMGHGNANKIFKAINEYITDYMDIHRVVSIPHMEKDFVLACANAKRRLHQRAIAYECPVISLAAFRISKPQ